MNPMLLEVPESTAASFWSWLEVGPNVVSATLNVLVGVENIEKSQVVISGREALWDIAVDGVDGHH